MDSFKTLHHIASKIAGSSGVEVDISSDITLENRDGRPVMVVQWQGEEFVLDSPCDANGYDVYDGSNSWGYQLVEVTYKGEENSDLVTKIKKMSKHPEAEHEFYTDRDGDKIWRVRFKSPASEIV